MFRDGQSFLPRLLRTAQSENRREAVLLECSYIKAVVTERWKYIANRPPEEIAKRMREEARECEDIQMRRIDWSGRSNWHRDEQGVIYSSNRDFPHYFDPDQLYDLEKDPYEQDNLVHEPQYRARVNQLKAQLKGIQKTLPHEFAEFTSP